MDFSIFPQQEIVLQREKAVGDTAAKDSQGGVVIGCKSTGLMINRKPGARFLSQFLSEPAQYSFTMQNHDLKHLFHLTSNYNSWRNGVAKAISGDTSLGQKR